jgi:hypothetical protein
MNRRIRHDYRPVWKPSPEAVIACVRRFFTIVPDDFIVIASRTVGNAVALALGVTWNPTLAVQVRNELIVMGGRPIVFSHRHLFARVQARHFDRADAIKLSMQLRGRKTLPREMR